MLRVERVRKCTVDVFRFGRYVIRLVSILGLGEPDEEKDQPDGDSSQEEKEKEGPFFPVRAVAGSRPRLRSRR